MAPRWGRRGDERTRWGQTLEERGCPAEGAQGAVSEGHQPSSPLGLLKHWPWTPAFFCVLIS